MYLLLSTVRKSQTDATPGLSLVGGPEVGPDVAAGHSVCKFIGFKRSGSLAVKVLQTSKSFLWKMEKTQLQRKVLGQEPGGPGGTRLYPKPAVGIKASAHASPKFCFNQRNGCKHSDQWSEGT